MDNFRENFDIILTAVKQNLSNILNKDGNIKRPGPKPKFSDAEVIALSLLSEILMIDSENYLFKKLNKNHKTSFPNLIERSVYNRRRKLLFNYIETLRENIVGELTYGEDTFIVDSMPLPISKFSRAKRLKICKDDYDTAPSYGYCAAQKMTYYGYKLHAITTVNGVITHFDLSKADMADIHYLQDIRAYYPGARILGDRAYLSDPLQRDLFETNRLLLETPKRRNQKNFRKYPTVFRRVRKRIETLYSQLHDQFKIVNNYAKTFRGLSVRILSKITGYTLLQYLNKYKFDNQLCHVKHSII